LRSFLRLPATPLSKNVDYVSKALGTRQPVLL
jgi:hypothetical protein